MTEVEREKRWELAKDLEELEARIENHEEGAFIQAYAQAFRLNRGDPGYFDRILKAKAKYPDLYSYTPQI